MSESKGVGKRAVIIARPEQLNEPDYIAQKFIENFHTENNKRTLHLYKGSFWSYAGNCYRRQADDMLRSAFHAHFCEEVRQSGTKVRNSGLENAAWSAVMARSTLSGDREMPSWLNELSPNGLADYNYVAFENGILNLNEAQKGRYILLPHTVDWFSPTCLPFNFDPSATCENWLSFLEDIFEADAERIALLQEWFGYCLTPDTSRHKFMLFEGVARAGKGTVKNVLVGLLGENNVSNIRLESFSDRFHLRQTVGKLLNVVDETDKVDRFQEGIFKTYVAAEMHYFDVKYKEGFEARPTARILILANERPPIADKSEGIWARLLGPLSFRKSNVGKEDFTLAARLARELPGIFNWALIGHVRLSGMKDFTLPTLVLEEKERYKRESNPAKGWLMDNFVACDGEDEAKDSSGILITYLSLYERYQLMCKQEGHKYCLNMSNFNREVKTLFPQLKEYKPRIDGKQIRAWRGFKETTD